jgi:[glutamine synthetase] adenylyltransferase / [glutamine synthetase]-adenylyl-L-tyrosine phosphorylase
MREGPGYTVDARLRPSGSFGPLIVSLESFQDYYQSQAQNWEKQALLKARVITGPPQLSRQITETIETVLYGTPPSAQVRNEMAHFRVRMEKERSGESEGKWNPKLGYGGLTDIEFIAQYLQWKHGQAHPELRQKNTLQVLKALKEAGFLSEDNRLLLRQAYEFLTLLDHGLQLFYDRKGDARTYSQEELMELSRQNWLGLGSTLLPSWDLVSHCEKVRRNVRTIFESVFSGHS